jgi:DNA-binding transcriptional ArsR family regulator
MAVSRLTEQDLEGAAALFKALADPLRLKTLVSLADAPLNVGQISELDAEKLGTVSARLKVLWAAKLVTRHREGQNIVYSLADKQALDLIHKAVEHTDE